MEPRKPDAQSAATPGSTSPIPASPSPSKSGGRPTFVTTAAGAEAYLTDRQIEILEARGIDTELAVRMGWRSGRKGYGEEIEIPFFMDGKEVNCKTRTIEGDKRFHQVAGGTKCFYNVDALRDLGEHPLVITEGEMDCIIALQCGYVAVSVPDGAPAHQVGDHATAKYDYLHQIPRDVKKIILATDSDDPGLNLLHDLSLRLGAHRCMWVKYPKGCKDLNDTFKAWGKRGVDETISRAQYMEIDGLYEPKDLPPTPKSESFDVGISTLEGHFRLRRGDLSVVTGIPSHGKSTFVNHIAHNMAVNHGWRTCFASFEQPPQDEHMPALRTLFHEIPDNKQSPADKDLADAFIAKHFVFVVPSDHDDNADMTWLKDRLAAAVTRYDTRLVVIDPWNEIDHEFDGHEMTTTQYIGKTISELKRFARRFRVHVMIVAHPAKMRREKNGQYPIPSAYDIADSSHFYNKPDQILVIHRADKDKTLVRVAKSRYHNALGTPGDVELKFNTWNYKFEPIAVQTSWMKDD